ncbi:MAG: alpha-amylase family glycosyl hydrolase [Spirochaetaceae bacterium]|jgi:glycosidase|nr:alpha-amylase family glycosyl hydrolase [Spirochaetaceae bacterium]
MTLEQSLELHLSNVSRKKYSLEDLNFSETGKLVVNDSYQINEISENLNTIKKERSDIDFYFKSGDLNALAIIEKINHFLIRQYLLEADNLGMRSTLSLLDGNYGKKEVDKILTEYSRNFSSKKRADHVLEGKINNIPVRELLLEEIILLKICNNNPAASVYKELFDDEPLSKSTKYTPVFYTILEHFDETPSFGPGKSNLVKLLMEPALKHPHSLKAQLEYIKEKWGELTDPFFLLLMKALDLIKEENKIFFHGPGPTKAIQYNHEEDDSPNFSRDSNWMPEVVLLAKNSLVWLDQLSRDYKREIKTLNQIPGKELDTIASRGINCLWLIGIWSRSNASREIKKRCGNPDAVSSAYSLFSYDISYELGGWEALADLRHRCRERGIRLASDMVPNHTGIDSEWTRNKPQWFIQSDRKPFPSYTYNSENLSEDPGIGIYLEDHYYDKSDAAVTYKRVNFHTGETRYIYHGNDGTSMPWNDTAQLDFLQNEVRQAVIDQILHVAKNFPVIRFDAAMTLAKKHIQRLWYPEPGSGGDIASRSNFALSKDDFEQAVGGEFWKEVVARVAQEAPETLLLAEAFWMMEGYFVRNLGMHRVYNSAFMNMLKNEENDKYRETIKNTLNYDRKILKRFVNFMNNPDEETAAVQFGTGDKYFGVMTLMLTMPGLPMIGHGQIEGYKEKYGMEFKKALTDEHPDPDVVRRHEIEIFPILRKRSLFVSAYNFRLFDLNDEHGTVNGNVFAYSNRQGSENILVFYNNVYGRASGTIKDSVPYNEINGEHSSFQQNSLAESLNLTNDGEHYCLLKEIKSDTWYIRNSKELFDKGLFVHLNGYESQVFTDIHEMKNSDSNNIAAICRKLNGSGTKDLDREYREMIFKPIYSVLNPLINKSVFEKINSDDINFKTFAETIKEKLTSAVTAIKSFSSGTGDVALITKKIIETIAKTEDFKKIQTEPLNFEKKISLYLMAIFEQFGHIVSSIDGSRINRDLLDNWMISGYIRDVFYDENYDETFVSSLIMTIRYFIESINEEKILDISLMELQKLNGFGKLIGLNNYEGALWFSKEKFESLLWWLFYRGFLEIPLKTKPQSKMKKMKEKLDKWEKASIASKYDFNKFIDLI